MNKLPEPNNEPATATPVPPAVTPARPEFIRLPINGPCPWTGLTRSKLNELILPNYDQERAQHVLLQNAKLKVELRQLKRELIPADEVARVGAELKSAIRLGPVADHW